MIKEIRNMIDDWLETIGIKSLKYDVWLDHKRQCFTTNVAFKLAEIGKCR